MYSLRTESMFKKIVLSAILCFTVSTVSIAQFISSVELTTVKGLGVTGYTSRSGAGISGKDTLPLFSFELNDTVITSLSVNAVVEGDSIRWTSSKGIAGSVKIEKNFNRGWKATVTFLNTTAQKQKISGIVPLGEGNEHVFIKAAGPATPNLRLSRSKLFRPGVGAVGVILPDNAWELGFSDVKITSSKSLTAIARRTNTNNAEGRRFLTMLDVNGSVQYDMFVDEHDGDWQNGLRLMFRDRWIYDLEKFDNSLFERKDLAWVRSSYLMMLQFAWDDQYYNAKEGKYHFDEFLTKYDALIGNWETFMIWPTWPRLGLDERNQWDMYRDLPGGVKELRRQAEFAHKNGTKYFIAYNPWDQSTRAEGHTKGMEDMLRTIDGDGVVLDTWGESNKEFQDAADRVKKGIVLYSEGMAVPKDMPTLVAGRVHDAIYLPPPVNLNKLIKPEFAIFRVAQLAEGRIHRETAIAFFNGYGTELNIMRPGRPDWIEEELTYLGRTTKILRENSSAFLSHDWNPLLPALTDSIWVNKWPTENKTLYTILSLKPEGWSSALFEVPAEKDRHYVSLWNHEELNVTSRDGKSYIASTVDGFSRSWLGTRREGNVDCIASFPNALKVSVIQDSIRFEASGGNKIVVWAGTPSYSTKNAVFPIARKTISIIEHLGKHEEKFVVQLFNENNLLDERVVNIPLATPRLISHSVQTKVAATVPAGMVLIPAGSFTFKPTRSFLSPNEVIPYPGDSTSRTEVLKKYFMDQYPVTNQEYQQFINATKYAPKDPVNYLKHWVNGKPVKGSEKHPVVYVSLDDAQAYAKWAGKRLPVDMEWQYAAQGSDGRKYPWGNDYDSLKCNHKLGHTTPVDAFPAGESPFHVMDLIGNVWQLTNDVYNNGTFYFGMLRGGSHYNPTSSWWYIPGGPQPADNPQILLMVSPGFDRNATVGFRCVKDAVQ